MKSPNSSVRRALALVALSSLMLLAACGQKGPLFMPKIPPDPLAKTAPKPADKPAATDGTDTDGGKADATKASTGKQ